MSNFTINYRGLRPLYAERVKITERLPKAGASSLFIQEFNNKLGASEGSIREKFIKAVGTDPDVIKYTPNTPEWKKAVNRVGSKVPVKVIYMEKGQKKIIEVKVGRATFPVFLFESNA